jgi:transposase-like protein
MKLLLQNLEKNINDILHYDKNDAVEHIVKTVFETILFSERACSLQEDKESGLLNKANGYYQKLAKCVNKYLKLNVPRDRLGLFKPMLLDAIKEKEEEMLDMAFLLYKKGLTTRDIRDVFKDIYDKKLSPSSVSILTKNFQEQRECWQNRQLEEEYYFAYIDALYIPVRRETVQKEAFYAVIGLRKDLKREILGVYNIPQESASGWKEVFQDLKKRGVKKILMFIADGISGLENVLQEEYPDSFLQKCLLHKIKNVLIKVRSTDKSEVVKDFYNVFRLEKESYTLEKGQENLKSFIQKWSKSYKWIGNKFEEKHIQNYFAYLNFPSSIHRMIYTTNWVERLNKAIRRTQRMRNSL